MKGTEIRKGRIQSRMLQSFLYSCSWCIVCPVVLIEVPVKSPKDMNSFTPTSQHSSHLSWNTPESTLYTTMPQRNSSICPIAERITCPLQPRPDPQASTARARMHSSADGPRPSVTTSSAERDQRRGGRDGRARAYLRNGIVLP